MLLLAAAAAAWLAMLTPHPPRARPLASAAAVPSLSLEALAYGYLELILSELRWDTLTPPQYVLRGAFPSPATACSLLAKALPSLATACSLLAKAITRHRLLTPLVRARGCSQVRLLRGALPPLSLLQP